jgi:hypothetical protein
LTVENGNGELKQLLEIKRGYRKGLTSLEEELKAKFERDLADGKKRLREQYLEGVVDVVFAEPAASQAMEPTPIVTPQVEVKTEVTSKPGPSLPVIDCPGCGARVDANARFCSQCAYPLNPLKEDEKLVAATGRSKLGTRVRR